MSDFNTLLGTVFYAWILTFIVSVSYDGVFSIFDN